MRTRCCLYPKIEKTEYDGGSSLFYVDDGRVIACVLNSAGTDFNFHNEWVYLTEGEEAGILMGLISASADACDRVSPGKAGVYIVPVNEKGKKLARIAVTESEETDEFREYRGMVLPLGVYNLPEKHGEQQG